MSRTITLGTLIRHLEVCKPEARVQFDFGGMEPTTLDSWRGIYSDLALGYTKGFDTIKVADLLAALRAANGKTFDGYKGGKYAMDLRTPVWVDNYSEYTSTAIRGVRDFGHYVLLETEHCP